MILIFVINFLLGFSTVVGMTIIPLLVTESLSLSFFVLGIIEGATEFISNLIKLSNGIMFDKIKNKRFIFVISIGIALVAKVLLLLPNIWTIAISKTLERVANGAFASPRDAYVAEKSRNNKGLGLGLLGGSKAAGCIFGGLFVAMFGGDFTTFQHLHFLVGSCCIVVLIAFIGSFFLEIQNLHTSEFSLDEFRLTFKQITAILTLVLLFFIGRFSDGLLTVYLKYQGFPEKFYLATMTIFNCIIMVSSPIIGARIQVGSVRQMVYLSIGALLLFNLAFYSISGANWGLAIVGLLSWGLQRSGSQIVFASLVVKKVARSQYGTAMGIYYLVSGLGTLVSSLIGGYMTKYDFKLLFLFSGCCAVICMVFANYILNKNQDLVLTATS